MNNLRDSGGDGQRRWRLVALLGTVLAYPVLAFGETLLVGATDLPALAWLSPVDVVPFVVALVAPPLAVLAIPVGYGLGDATSGVLGAGTVVGAGVHLYIAYSVRSLAGTARRPGSVLERVGWLLRVVALPAAGAAAITGWGAELLGQEPFYVAVIVAFPSALLLGLVGTAVALALTDRWADRPVDGASAVRNRWPVLLTVSWVGLGAVMSLGYRVFEQIPADSFLRRNLDVMVTIQRSEFLGPGAGRLQVVFGAVMFVTLLAALPSSGLRSAFGAVGATIGSQSPRDAEPDGRTEGSE